ncbi:MAG: hypothetical protein QM634_14400, partial [Gordonia sp. (in: high G+C Gram-positive bacteria)]
MADLTKRPEDRAPTSGGVDLTRSAPAPQAGRYAQFTYTSFDATTAGGAVAPGQRGHGGGWQVKQVLGNLDPAYVDELAARIVTRFDLEPPLPGFPTPEQIVGRPARLSYVATAGPTGWRGAYWHTVDAGRDGSGRPGNVFAHILADAHSDADGRPIDLWRWSGWLAPYGPDEVKAAELAEPMPPRAANPALSNPAVIAFLLDPGHDRVSVLRVLLDAVSARLSGEAAGPAALAVDFVDAAAHDRAAVWIAAVSSLLTPIGARRFCWSTHESPEAVAGGAAADLHLVAVPKNRVGDVAGQVVVVDEHEEPYLGDPGSEHRVAAGVVPATPLSVLAEAVFADEHTARRVLARRDEVAAQFETDGSPALAPEWPLAVAVLEIPELAEFHEDAAEVVVDDAPDGVEQVAWARDLVGGTLASRPPTPDAAMRRLGRAHRRGRGT